MSDLVSGNTQQPGLIRRSGEVDWLALRAAAVTAAQNAYAPYSEFRVGAAGLTERGTIVTGCNVENASYGLTLCAECGMVGALHASGCHRLVAASIVAGDGAPLTPCGRCRQILIEAGGPGLVVEGPGGLQRLGELLPGAFDDETLKTRGGSQNR
ncbi:MAG: cytidine deaminase [Solirubrobacteraceae bacterium]